MATTKEPVGRRWIPTRVRILLPLFMIGACGDEVPIAPALSSERPATPIALDSRPTAEERTAASVVARSLAAAMENREARQELMTAMASASHREGKLHLSSFLLGRGKRLLDEAEPRTGAGRAEVIDALRKVRELELYVPVAGHRAKWTTEAVPVVAFSLNEEAPIIAVDATGHSQYLARDYPPLEPVVVATPIETDLSVQVQRNHAGEAESSCDVGERETLQHARERCGTGRNSGITTANSVASLDGLYVEYAELYDGDAEVWWRGDPELELHVRDISSQGEVGQTGSCQRV